MADQVFRFSGRRRKARPVKDRIGSSSFGYMNMRRNGKCFKIDLRLWQFMVVKNSLH